MEKYLTPKEVAEGLSMSIYTIYNYIKEGRLKAVEIGNRYRISKKEFDNFIASHTA